MKPEDYPPVFWVRDRRHKSAVFLVLYMDETAVIFGLDEPPACTTYMELADSWEYSSDRKVWCPCYKMEDAT